MADLQKEIQECNDRMQACFKAGDFKGLSEHYTDDCKIMEPGAVESMGKSGVEAVFKRQKESGAASVELSIEEVGVLGTEICYERHNYKTIGKDGATLDQGKSLVIWKKVGGQWKAYIDIFNSNM